MRRRGRQEADEPAGAPKGSSSQLRAFINYRREDASGHAGRLYDSLTAAMGEENVFMDIDAIPAGEDFPTVIDRALQTCDVLLALVGTRWLTIADSNGRPRLEDPEDFVRLEIEGGLERADVVVIPVLVQEAQMPRAGDLPQSMAALTRRNAFQLSDNRWHSDVDRLIHAMGRVASEKRARELREKAEREARESGEQAAAGRGDREARARPQGEKGQETALDQAGKSFGDRRIYWLSLPILLLIALGIFLAVNHHTQQTILQGHTAGLQGSSLQTEHINTLATSRYYKNPLVEVNLPDPTVIKAQGKYFAYTTQTYGKSKHLPMLVSNNLIAWRFLGDALPHKPVWALDSDKGNTWAPDAIRINDLYYLYFSETLKSKGMGIAVETSKSPEGPFHVVGPPLLRAHGYRDIDPFVFQEKSGELLLYWGSAKRPIKVQRLSSDGTSLLGKPQKVLYPSNDTTYDHLVEGADVIRHGAFYYLFYSGNRCCRERAHYAELVARSLSPVGPFKRDPKNPVIEKNQVFKAPGHGTVFKDAMGDYFILYHAMQLSDPTFQRYLMLDRIQWQGGWPVVNGGNGPSSTRQPRPSPT